MKQLKAKPGPYKKYYMYNHFKIIAVSLSFLILFNCQNKYNKIDEQNSGEEDGWIQLFNGIDLNDWTVKINGQPVDSDPLNTFIVEDGILKVSYDNYEDFGQSYGHIFYKEPFDNYKLKMQYRFVGEQVHDAQSWARRNSGVMIHSQSPESMGLNQGFPVSLEVQFLGGLEHDVERPTGNLCTPGTHVTINDELVTQHCIDSSSQTFYGEEWIDVEVIVTDSIISHKINGEDVIQYSNPVFGGEYSVDEALEGKPVTSGYISLQSESHPIEFRNIELLEF